MKVIGIVFDMDGTLAKLGGFVNWKHAYHQVKLAYLECGCSHALIEELRERNLFNMINLVRDENVRSMNDETVRNIQKSVYAVVEKYELEGIKHCSLTPGCVETLDWIRSHEITMGVATSNSEYVAKKVFEFSGIIDYFSAIVGRRPELRMKPHPDQILKCLEEMGVNPSQGLVVGDSVKDVQSAKSANVPVISIPSFFTRREAIERLGADEIIGSLSELPSVIEKLNDLR